jgi:transcriptional regulator with XRE-family HTH domain
MGALLRKGFGAQVRRIRQTLKLNQDELGKRAGTNGKVIGEIERGVRNPTIDTIERLLKALGVEPFEAFAFHIFKKPQTGRTIDEEAIVSLVRRSDLSVRPLLLQLLEDALSWAQGRKK